MSKPSTSQKHRILVVEDADSFRQLMASYLRQQGYSVDEAWSEEAAERSAQLIRPDLAIVDLELGDKDGFQLLRFLNDLHIASMVVSVRSDVADRIAGLELGANDYMVKPIDLRELKLRVGKILSSLTSNRTSQVMTIGDISIDIISRQVTVPGRRSASLTPNEFKLLRLLVERKNKIIERHVLFRDVLSKIPDVDSRALDVLVSKLRSKIDAPGKHSLIRAVRGSGYMLAVDEGAEQISAA